MSEQDMSQVENQTADAPLLSNVTTLGPKKPRIEPIEKPKGFGLRIAYWATGRPFGKVPTNIKILVARMPKSVKSFTEIGKFEIKGIHLDKGLHHLIGTLVSGINGCGYCLDLGRAMAIKENLDMNKFNALPGYKTSPLFSEKERAALAYVEQVTRSKRVDDSTFEELRTHFSDQEIVEITWITAIQNFYNLLNIPLEIGSDGFCAIAQSVKKS
jgi:alkylhydroperoxidase family enzyme